MATAGAGAGETGGHAAQGLGGPVAKAEVRPAYGEVGPWGGGVAEEEAGRHRRGRKQRSGHLLTWNRVPLDGCCMTHVLVVSSSVGVLHGVHGNTSYLWPGISLSLVLVK